MKNRTHFAYPALIAAVMAGLVACGSPTGGGEGYSTEIVDLPGLNGNTVYLVKVNTGNAAVSGDRSGSVTWSLEGLSGSIAPALNAAPQPGSSALGKVSLGHAPPEYARPIEGGVLARPRARAAPAYTVDLSTKTFWAQTTSDTTLEGQTELSSTLRAQGTHCNIWVADVNYDNSSSSDTDNKITSSQAQTLATTFGALYDKETNLIGYERGGGPGGDGGADGDQRIQILVFDIDGDYSSSQNSGIWGYYWAKDNYATSTYSTSNQCEMFYVDAHFTDRYLQLIKGTLAHEFQHMINFNQKRLVNSISTYTASWYEEMLAELANDVMSEFVGISTGDSAWTPRNRASYFLNYYDKEALTVWGSGDDAYISYAKAYFFGAYLVRNYGGPALLREMVTNNAIDEASIDLALRTVNGDGTLTMRKALERYGEALVYSKSVCGGEVPAGVNTYDKDVSGTVNGQDYTFYGFDIWTLSSGEKYGFTGSDGVTHTTEGNGPHVHDAAQQVALPPLSLTLHTTAEWQSVTGSLRLTLTTPPAASGVKFYVLVR